MQRGRKGVGAREMLSLVDLTQEKPQPPGHLPSNEAQVWRDVVAAMRPGSFIGATFPLLERYCSHVVQARFLAAELRKCKLTSDPDRYKLLLTMLNGQIGI